MARKRKLDPGVTTYVDRHGKERARFRLKGMDCAIPHPSSPDYKEAYKLVSQGIVPRQSRTKARSVGDLFERFYASPVFNRTTEKWKQIVRSTLEDFRNKARDVPVSDFTFEHIENMLADRAKKREDGRGGPKAAERLKEQLARLFDYAIRLGWISVNPAKFAELPMKVATKGFHIWTEEEVEQFQDRHALGTQARLAMEIAFWTGLRRADIAKLGPRHLRHGRIVTGATKTGKTVDVVASPDLLAAIEAMPKVGETFLSTQYGKPFTDAGLGNWFRDRADEAGLNHCTLHGLRKALTTIAANKGATQQQLKALGQWSNDAEVATYAKGADQRRLADEAILRVIEARTESNQRKKVRQKSSKAPNKALTMAGAEGKE